MTWTSFAEQSPDLARRGPGLLAEKHGYVYLATVAAVLRRSPKLADLRREPRIALHSTVMPPDDEEFSVRGVVRGDRGRGCQESRHGGARGGATLTDAMALFEVDLLEAGWTRWPDGTPTREHWRAEDIDLA